MVAVLRCLFAATLVIGTAVAEAKAAPAAEELFVHRIAPLLAEKCVACHGGDPQKFKGGLDLRSLPAAIKGGESGKAAILPGKPAESPIYLASRGDHEDWSVMPPKVNDRLSKEQVAYVHDWIAGGAPWPDDARAAAIRTATAAKWQIGIKVRTSGGLGAQWTDRTYKPEDLWAYRPVVRPPIPAGREKQNPIDALIDDRLQKQGIIAARLADRRTLIRRVTFDLIGLPPTPEDIAAFLADPAPDLDAYTRLVDHLLASPHYGEQMARHWLDIARYADSSGFANDYERGPAWRYRDYVVRSFNANKPYDQFVREQIAGDELAPGNAESLVATGFLRMGAWELTGMEVAKIARQRFLDDVTDSVGQVFLAHMLQCARCHDHKFDPVPTRDYYAIQAAFATTQLADRPAAFLPTENTTGFEERRYVEQRGQHYELILHQMNERMLQGIRRWYADCKIDPSRFEQALKTANGQAEKARLSLRAAGVPEDQIPPKNAGFTGEDFGIERIARKGQERLKWAMDRYEPVTLSVYNGKTPDVKTVNAPMRMPRDPMNAGELENTCILTGGDPFSPGTPVSPGTLSATAELANFTPPRIPTEPVGRRTALANWIASPANPLTARVMVNRLWQWHFGQAIAGNPNNFGSTGKKPTHPELLDLLADEFVKSGWSVKHIHRLILLSETYRRSSNHPDARMLATKDANGTSYAAFKPRRLTAEELRDATLATTGELNRTLGGIPIRPEINLEVALQPRQVMGTYAEAWQPSPKPEQRHRRSIYVLRLRGMRDPFMDVFNAPAPDLSCEARDTSTVTPQVFSLFNAASAYDRALALAHRATKESKSHDGAIARAIQLAFGRDATADELQVCRKHLDQMIERHKQARFERRLPPKQVIREAIDENTGEPFKFVEPLEAAKDFVPDLQPADASPELRALADICLVLLNANEFVYVY